MRLKVELEECIGDLGAALPAEDEHAAPGDGHREVAARRRALPLLRHLLPLTVLALVDQIKKK